MNRHRTSSVLVAAAIAACSLAACAAPSQKVAGPSPSARRPGLTVAEDGPAQAGEIVVVNASAARTFVGHFRAGDRVRIDVLDAQWNPEPGSTFYDAAGVPGERCRAAPASPCIGGDAPLLGLILLTATAVPENASRDSTCMAVQRLYIPNGAEFLVPVDSEITLGPNDFEDGLHDNKGEIRVEVERAAGKKDPAIERREVLVSARLANTLAGRFRAGEYVRVTVKDGSWNNDPSARLVDSAGYRDQPCGGVGHVCVGGEGKPLMGLVLMMSCFSITQQMMPLQRIDRRFIPRGTELVLPHDADLFLAPNDTEDGLANNTGSARVRVHVLRR
jgi:hypothetical protein